MNKIYYVHAFWYHSPVRFYRTLDELQDMTNPQNTQYFGEKRPFPLQTGDFHRFIIPNYNNEVTDTELFIYCGDQRITSVCEIDAGRLKYVTFRYNSPIKGRLEIRNAAGDVRFYSNCVEFLDSTLADGRRFIRIATKHLYNRHLFDFQSDYNWIICSIPAYPLGFNAIEAEISNARTGGNNTLRVRETYLDEVVSYEFIARGDANLLNFLQVHSTNNNFYINGNQQTAIEKMDRDEFSNFGRMSFASVKSDGLNVQLDYDAPLNDIFVWVLTDDTKTILYTDDNNNLIQVK